MGRAPSSCPPSGGSMGCWRCSPSAAASSTACGCSPKRSNEVGERAKRRQPPHRPRAASRRRCSCSARPASFGPSSCPALRSDKASSAVIVSTRTTSTSICLSTSIASTREATECDRETGADSASSASTASSALSAFASQPGVALPAGGTPTPSGSAGGKPTPFAGAAFLESLLRRRPARGGIGLCISKSYSLTSFPFSSSWRESCSTLLLSSSLRRRTARHASTPTGNDPTSTSSISSSSALVVSIGVFADGLKWSAASIYTVACVSAPEDRLSRR